MKETYVKKILAKMKEKNVDLGTAAAMVFDEERTATDFNRANFDYAEAKFKKYAPEIIAENKKTGLNGFKLDEFIAEIEAEKAKVQ